MGQWQGRLPPCWKLVWDCIQVVPNGERGFSLSRYCLAVWDWTCECYVVLSPNYCISDLIHPTGGVSVMYMKS